MRGSVGSVASGSGSGAEATEGSRRSACGVGAETACADAEEGGGEVGGEACGEEAWGREEVADLAPLARTASALVYRARDAQVYAARRRARTRATAAEEAAAEESLPPEVEAEAEAEVELQLTVWQSRRCESELHEGQEMSEGKGSPPRYVSRLRPTARPTPAPQPAPP